MLEKIRDFIASQWVGISDDRIWYYCVFLEDGEIKLSHLSKRLAKDVVLKFPTRKSRRLFLDEFSVDDLMQATKESKSLTS